MKNIIRVLFVLTPIFSYSQKSIDQPVQKAISVDTLTTTQSLNRAWTPLEFQQALNDIINRQKDSSYETPTLENNKKELFTKLTTYDNYWFIKSKYQTLNERFTIVVNLYEPVKALLFSYYRNSKVENGKLIYEKEITEFHNLLVKLTIDQVELTDEFIKVNPNLSKVQLDGLKQMIYGINTMLGSDLTVLEKEYSYFSNVSICKICSSFKGFYSFMYKRIDNDTKAEFDKRVETLVKTHDIQCVREMLKEKR